METRKGISEIEMGYVQRAASPVSPGDWVTDAPHHATILVCVAKAAIHVRSISIYQRRPAVHTPVLTRMDRRYGFVDAFNLGANWFDSDVVGIDLGITLLSAENLLTGNVWRWFMSNDRIPYAMNLLGFSPPPGLPTAPPRAKKRKPKRV